MNIIEHHKTTNPIWRTSKQKAKNFVMLLKLVQFKTYLKEDHKTHLSVKKCGYADLTYDMLDNCNMRI